jgi:RNA methyltransferase, TrmH family
MNLNQSELKYLRSLQKKKVREAEQKFLLEGWKPLSEALKSGFKIEMIAVTKDSMKKSGHNSLIELAGKRRIPVKELKDVQLNQITDTVHSQGVIALIHKNKESFKIDDLRNANMIVACNRINDPGNLGTILRSCDWFGVEAVLTDRESVSIYNEKVIRSTAGSIFHLKAYEDVELLNALRDLRSAGFNIIATSPDGKSVFTEPIAQKSVLLLGSEADGLDRDLINIADLILSIPRFGQAESLNVGIACGIMLAQWRDGTHG